MRAGRVIDGRYRLLSKLGQGGMGEVWRGEHLGLGTPVAVKLLSPTVLDSKLALARFKREAQSAASLRSSNVVQILDYGVDADSPYIVMELLVGETLTMRLGKHAPLAPRAAARILTQVGKAVAKAHALSIVHRDLKPDNIFLVRDGEEEVAKVLDFGIAKTLSSDALASSIQTKSGAILGTPHYMSPEQAAGRGAIDHRSDIWSFGVIAFECLTATRPFNGSTLGGLVIAICNEPIPKPSSIASVPRGFDAWFARCMSRDLSQRFQSMADAAATLRVVCDPPTFASAPPMQDAELREATLQASSRNPTPFDPAERSSSKPPGLETVSASARTLNATHRRRSVVLYVVGGAILAGGGVLLGVNIRGAEDRGGDSTALDASLGNPVGSALPETSVAQVSTLGAPTLVPLAPVSSNGDKAPIIVLAPSASLTRAGSARPRRDPASAQLPTNPVNAPAAQPSTTTAVEAVVAPEPVHGPEPAPTETPEAIERRKVEDRLAF